VLVDAIEVRLQQHAAVRLQQAFGVRERCVVFGRDVSLRIARARADARLDHEFGDGAGKESPQRIARIVAGLDECARHRRHAGRRELGKIVLVGVPAHDIGRVQELRLRGGTFGPAQEIVQPVGVVPGRAQHGDVEARPVDRSVVPVDDREIGAGLAHRGGERRKILVEIACGGRSDERDVCHS